MKVPNKQKYFVFGVFIFVFSLVFVFQTEAFSLPSKVKINETIQNLRTLKVPEFISETPEIISEVKIETFWGKTTAAIVPTIGELIQGAMKVGKNVIGTAKEFFADATSSPQADSTSTPQVVRRGSPQAEVKKVEQTKAPVQEINFSLPKISISDEELKIPEIQKISKINAPQFVTEKEKIPYEPITPVRVVRISVVGDIASDVWNSVTKLLSPDEKLVVVDETTNLKINTATTKSEKTKLEFSLPKVSISNEDLKIPEVSKINAPQFLTEKESAPYQLTEPIRTIRVSVIGDIASDVWNKILAIFKREKVIIVEPEKPVEEKVAEAPAAAPEKEVVIREIIRERIIERPVQEVRISVPSLPAGLLTPYPQAAPEVIRETIVRETTTAIDNTALNAMNTSIQAQIASLMTVIGQSSPTNSSVTLTDLTDTNIPNDLTINSTKGLSATTGGFSGALTVSGASNLTANVGISTTTPGAALGVKGSGLFGGNLVTSFIRATSTTATSTFDGGVRLARTAGNVGIGTSSPGSHMLAVAGDILIGGTSTSTFQGNVEIDGILKIGQGTSYLTANDLTASNGFTINSDVANKDIVLNSSGSVGFNTSTPWAFFSVDHDWADADKPVLVVSDQGTSTPSLLIDWRGRVGIGTSTPGARFAVKGLADIGSLFVEGAIKASSLISTSTALSGFGTTTPWGLLSVEQIASGNELLPAFVVGDTGTKTPSLIVMNGTGNVGIGDYNPTTLLSIRHTAQVPSLAISSATSSPFWIKRGGDGISGSWTLRTINKMLVHNGKLYAGTGNSAGEAEVWEYNGNTWTKIGGDAVNSSWADATYERVSEMVSYNGRIYVGLGTGAGEAEVWEYTGSSWTQIGGDAINSSWADATYDVVQSMILFNGKLYAGLGNSAGEAEVWEYNGSSWTQIGGDTLNSSWAATYEYVLSMTTYSNRLYAGVSGSSAGEAEVWEYNGSSWTQIGGDAVNSSWADTTYDAVRSIISYNGKLYAGLGDTAGEAEVWEYNGSSWTQIGGDAINSSWPAGIYSTTWSMISYNGKLYAGLGQDNAGDAEIWEYNGAAWIKIGGDAVNSSWADATYETVESMISYNGKLYAGLGYSTVGNDGEIWEYNTNSVAIAKSGEGLNIGNTLTIGNNNRVGIGVVDPTADLDVLSSLRVGVSNLVASSSRVGIGTTSPWGTLAIEQQHSGNELLPAFVVSDVGTATPSFIVMNATQRIGVATTSPRFNLGIVGTSFISGNAGFGGILDVQGTGTSTFDGGISVTGKGIASSQGLVVSAGESYFTGKVGIGTTSPGTLLSVKGLANIGSLIVEGGLKTSFVIATSTTNNTFAGALDVTESATSSFTGGVNITTTGGLSSASGLVVSTGETYLAGKVGIATTSPGSLLSVQGLANIGSLRVEGAARVSSLISTSTAVSGFGTSTPWGNFAMDMGLADQDKPAFVISDNGTSTSALLVDSFGRVGIGITDAIPSHTVQINNTSFTPAIALSATTSPNGYWSKVGGDGTDNETGTGWAATTYERVYTLIEYGGKLYAGLAISSGDAEVWEYNPTTKIWTKVGGDGVENSWGAGYDAVHTFEVYNGRLYAGLISVTVAGAAEVWEYDGISWTKIGGDGIYSSWADSTYEEVLTMVAFNGKLYAGLGGNTVTNAGDAEVWEYNGSAWTKIGGDAINSSWADLTYEYVHRLGVYNGRLYAGLGYTTDGYGEVWEYNGTSWTKIGGDSVNSSWASSDLIYGFISHNNKLYTSIGGDTAGDAEVWEYNGSSWTKIGGDGVNSSWADSTYEEARPMTIFNGELYLPLGYSTGDAEIWKYNGSKWTKVGGDSVNYSWASASATAGMWLAPFNGKLYAGLAGVAGDGDVWEYNVDTTALFKDGNGLTLDNALTIGRNKFVGINTNEPQFGLDIKGGLRVDQAALVASSSAVGIGTSTPWGTLSIEQRHSGSENLPAFVVGDQGSNTPSFVILNGTGRVGIATDTPALTLSIGGNILVGGTATNTFDNGIKLKAGCFLMSDGTCAGKGVSSYLGLSDTPSSFTAKSIPYTNTGATALLHSASLVFDGTNFGVGTDTPWGNVAIEQIASGNELLPAFVVGDTGTKTPSLIVMNGTGNVGIGDYRPTTPLSIRNTSQIPIITLSSATGSPAWVQRGGDGIGGSWNTNYEYVNTSVSYNGKLYVGLGVTAGDAEVWEYNNSTWKQIGGDAIYSSWAAATYELVTDLIVYNGRLYAALGTGADEAEVWEFNGSSWTQIGGDSIYSSWGSGYDYVYTMDVFRGELVVGLSATAGEAEVWRYNGSSWTQIGGDSVNSSWAAASLYEEVFSLGTHNNNLYAGLGNTAGDGEVWEFNGSAWTQIAGDSVNSSWASATYVDYLLSFNGKLYAATGAAAGEAEVWEYNGSTWTQIGGDSLNSSWSTSYTQVQQLIAYNGKLYAGLGALAGQAEIWEYIGPNWTQIGGDTINGSWDATNYERTQQAMVVHNGKLYAGVTGTTAGEAEFWEYNTNSVAIAKSGDGLSIGNTLTIGSNNRVGIGVVDPAADLDVLSSFRVGGSNLVASSSRVGIGTSTPWGILSIEQQHSSSETMPAFVISDVGTATPSFIVMNATGRVGIGTTSPWGTFTIEQIASGAENLPAFAVGDTGTSTASFVILNGTGRTGVGTSSPWGQFAVEHATGGDNQLIPAFVVADKGTGTPSFIVLNKNGYVGVGTSSPWGGFSIEILASGSEDELPSFVVGDTGSSTPALAVYSSGITQIDQLQTGALSFDTNAGAVSWIDMPVTSSAVWGTVESYSAQIDATSTLTVYSQSNGKGGVFRSRIGIATTSPGATFAISHSTTSQYAMFIDGDSSRNFVIDGNMFVGIGTNTPRGVLAIDSNATIPALLIKAGGSGSGNIAIAVDADDTCKDSGNTATCILNDLAELFPTSEILEAGDIAMLDSSNPGKIKKATENPPTGGRNKLVGVISTSPAIVFEGSGLKAMGGIYQAEDNKAPVSLAGRVPVKINGEGGDILVGDPITISSIAGVGKKATTAGLIVGYSMEDWTPSTGSGQDPANEKIIVVAETGYWVPPVDATLTLETNNESLTADSSGLLAQVIDIVADWLRSTVVQIKKLIVGSPEAPTGITLYDLETRQPYCFVIRNGQPDYIPGECTFDVANTNNETSSGTSSNGTSDVPNIENPSTESGPVQDGTDIGSPNDSSASTDSPEVNSSSDVQSISNTTSEPTQEPIQEPIIEEAVL